MRSASILATLPLAALAAPSIQARAPLHIPRTTELVEGKYIVKMKSGADVSTMTALNVAPERVFKKFGGFAASLTPEMVEELRNHSDVCDLFPAHKHVSNYLMLTCHTKNRLRTSSRMPSSGSARRLSPTPRGV